MSIAGFPNNYFENRFGACLVRLDAATGLWNFVAWAPQNATYIEQLAPGSYTYQIWLVIGYQNTVTTLESTGVARIAVLGAKK